MKDTRIRIGNHLKDLFEYHGCSKREVDTITIKAGTEVERELNEIIINWLFRLYEYRPCVYDANNKELTFFKTDGELEKYRRKRNDAIKKFG